jgi:hypothetical protein
MECSTAIFALCLGLSDACGSKVAISVHQSIQVKAYSPDVDAIPSLFSQEEPRESLVCEETTLQSEI